MGTNPNNNLLYTSSVISRWGVGIIGALSVLIGSFMLMAWLSGTAPEWSAAGVITMKTNMVLALLLLAPERPSGLRRLVGAVSP